MKHRRARYQLQQLRQKSEEAINDFITCCGNQTTKCKFRDLTEADERLIEQLIDGTKHKKIQERLLEKGEDLAFDKAIDIARTYKATQSQLDQLDEGAKKDVCGIRQTTKTRSLPQVWRRSSNQTERKIPSIWLGLPQLRTTQPLGKSQPQTKESE